MALLHIRVAMLLEAADRQQGSIQADEFSFATDIASPPKFIHAFVGSGSE